MTHASILEKYRSLEFNRSVGRALAGVPVALVLNSALLVGLVNLGKGLEVISSTDIPIDIVVTDVEESEVVEAKLKLEEPVVEPPPETPPIVAENPEPPPPTIQQPEPTPPPPAPKFQSQPELTPQLSTRPEPELKTPAQQSPLSNLLKEVIPNSGATESTETPASGALDSSLAPGSGTEAISKDGSGTSEFADRIRSLLKGSGAPTGNSGAPAGASTAEPPAQNRSRFGCVQCEKPNFPIGAKERGLQGEAKVSLDVDANGNVTAVRLVNSSGHPELDQAVIEQAKKWRFTPSEGGKKGFSARVDFQIEGTEYHRQSQERQRQREALRQKQQVEQQAAPVPERPVTAAPRSVEPPAFNPPPEPPAPVYEPPPPPEPIAAPPPVYEAPLVYEEPPPPVYEPPPIEEESS